MAFFCIHNYRARKVLEGANLLGDVIYAIGFYCTRCGKRRVRGNYSKQSAYDMLDWFLGQQDK